MAGRTSYETSVKALFLYPAGGVYGEQYAVDAHPLLGSVSAAVAAYGYEPPHLLDADVQSVVDYIFVYESNRENDAWIDIIAPEAPVVTDDLYPFVIDAASWTRLADGVVPDGVGKPETILDTPKRSVGEVLADLEANGGTWTTCIFHNPSTDTEQLKRTYLQLQDGLVFGSGYYIPDSISQTAVHTAIMIYDQDPGDAFDQVNARPDEANPFYSFIMNSDTGAVLAQGVDAGTIGGSDWQAITRTLPAVDIMRELEVNPGLVAYDFVHPGTEETENKRAWLRLHGGYVFGSGYYESDAPVDAWSGE